jgi:hypothetical protein
MGTEKDYIIGSLISYQILLMSTAKFPQYACNICVQAYFLAVCDDSEVAASEDAYFLAVCDDSEVATSEDE